MSLLSIAQEIQATSFFTYLRSSTFTYPILLTLHMVGIAMFGGMVLLSDLRLLGISMRHRTISDVVEQLRVPKRFGLLLLATCGILLAGSKAEEYYYNAFFRTKMILLLCVGLHALIFRKSVYGNTQALDQAPAVPAQAKLAATLSLMLWTGLVIAGRGIGYIEPPFDLLHASLEHVPSFIR